MDKCCFCGKDIDMNNRNNPNPACTDQNAVCCTECNYKIVLPSRVAISEIIQAGINGRKLDCVVIPDYSAFLNNKQVHE